MQLQPHCRPQGEASRLSSPLLASVSVWQHLLASFEPVTGKKNRLMDQVKIVIQCAPALRGRVAGPKRSIGIGTLASFRLMARPRPGRRLLSLALLVLQIQSFQLPAPQLHAAAAQSSRRPHGAGSRRPPAAIPASAGRRRRTPCAPLRAAATTPPRPAPVYAPCGPTHAVWLPAA